MTSNIRNMSTAVYERLKNASCILVALDCDKAGAEGWPRWRATFPRAKRWPVPMGKDAGEAVHNAVVLEELAMMAWHTENIAEADRKAPMQQELLDKHFLRKHGPGAYYGQKKS